MDFKFITFLIFFSVFFTGVLHIVNILIGEPFYLIMYPIICFMMIFSYIIGEHIINPIARWWLK